MYKRQGFGAQLDLSAVHDDAFSALFSESASRVLIAVTRDRADSAVERAVSAGIPVAVLGSTTHDGVLHLAGTSRQLGEQISMDALTAAWEATLPERFANQV